MFVQVMFLFAWIAAMQCAAIANPLLCPYGSATECHEGLLLRQREMLSHAAGLVHSAAEQGEGGGGDTHDEKSESDVVKRIQKLLVDFKKAQTDAKAAEQTDNARVEKSKKEIDEAEKEMKKHQDTSTASSSSWGKTQTPVFQWDEAFFTTAKGYTDSAPQKAQQAKSKAEEADKMEAEFQNAQSASSSGPGAVGTTEEKYLSIEKAIKDANDAIAEVRQNADAVEIAAYYVKTMMVSHSVFETVENITYMSTKSKTLIKEAESGIKEAESYLDIIPRKYVPKVKEFMVSIGALINPLKHLQTTSERVVNHAKDLQAIITEDKSRIKSMTSVQEAKCTLQRASTAAGLINNVADPVKTKTPFLNEAIKQGDEAKAKGLKAKLAYTAWYWTTTNEKIKEIKEAVAREKAEEEERKKKGGGVQIPQTPVRNEMSDLIINIPSTITLPSCNADGSEEIQTVNIGATKTGSDHEDSAVPIVGNGQEGDVKASDGSGSDGERKGDQGESFRRVERPSSGGAIPTKEPVDEKDIRPVDSTESNEFGGNGSSKRVPRREGSRDSASAMPSACVYAFLTLIMFLVTVQR